VVIPETYQDADDGSPRAQEERVARQTGGKRQRASGATIYEKGDVDTKGAFLVECKKTQRQSISVKWEWLTKISLEAEQVQKHPALAIEIQGGRRDSRTFGCERDWVCIPMRVFRHFVEESKVDGSI